MKMLLMLLSILSFLAATAVLFSAKSAVHEIESFILYLISAVLLSGAGIIEAIQSKQFDLPSKE